MTCKREGERERESRLDKSVCTGAREQIRERERERERTENSVELSAMVPRNVKEERGVKSKSMKTPKRERQALNFSQWVHHRKREDQKKSSASSFFSLFLSHHVLSVIHFRFDLSGDKKGNSIHSSTTKADEVDAQSFDLVLKVQVRTRIE